MHDKAVSQIRFEIEQIDRLLESYAGLLKRDEGEIPDLVEITAIASVLHSFYNGVENIFLIIAKNIDQKVPGSSQWHRDVLTQMMKRTSRRSQVLTTETVNLLTDYLGFRHFYRHSYSFFLEWDELEKLVVALAKTWNRLRNELFEFLQSLA